LHREITLANSECGPEKVRIRSFQRGFQVDLLVTMYDEASQCVRFHGVPIELIQAQANALGIPLLAYPTTPETRG
jgi:diphthamide synthase (EF-2-diphthine--ammonia ligase)